MEEGVPAACNWRASAERKAKRLHVRFQPIRLFRCDYSGLADRSASQMFDERTYMESGESGTT